MGANSKMPEFDRRVLEVLRQPLESGQVTISRAARQADFPARFQLVAAMNPCPCGYFGNQSGKCSCTPDYVRRYQERISGPLLDRIDIQVDVQPVDPDVLAVVASEESSAVIARRVAAAHKWQLERQHTLNQHMSTRDMDRHCRLDDAGEKLLRETMLSKQWSARAYFRVLKVARTIADLAGRDAITEDNVRTALQFRGALHAQQNRC